MADFEYYIKGDMALRCNSEGLWYLSVGDQVFSPGGREFLEGSGFIGETLRRG
ncbi:TPA: hypothetical protein L3577_000986 [Pseudomonas aeruginosa]|uniref:hypothetical protein n=1 Tax=Pseudomonas aeruginosa TaxID=287 RepID=UPI002875D0A6|nr:hypothetical protein [Pseudomonas aeruginosa]MDS1039084.1 hypothetical protein [Pseudomonas aeruginosa]HBN7583888.1 hypothetical protein [Pseudomonas aeruginosa]